MKRKIIRQGHNTLTMTLPSEWVKRFNLSAGAEVDLTEKDNGLFISTEKTNENKRTEFDISDMDVPTIWKHFMAVYREGYNEVLIKFNPNKQFDNPYKFLTTHRFDKRYAPKREKQTILAVLQGFVTRFIGFEIIEHGKDHILIKEMGELTSKEFDNSLRKIFFLIQEMAEETLASIKNKDPKRLAFIHDVDVNLDKFHDYCVRILNKTANKESRKSQILFSILFLLEMIGDEFKNISHHLIHDKHEFKSGNLIELANSVCKQLEVYQDFFYKYDGKKIKEISRIDSEIYLKVPQLYKKANEDEKEVFHHLRMIGRFINSLLELRIEMEF